MMARAGRRLFELVVCDELRRVHAGYGVQCCAVPVEVKRTRQAWQLARNSAFNLSCSAPWPQPRRREGRVPPASYSLARPPVNQSLQARRPPALWHQVAEGSDLRRYGKLIAAFEPGRRSGAAFADENPECQRPLSDPEAAVNSWIGCGRHRGSKSNSRPLCGSASSFSYPGTLVAAWRRWCAGETVDRRQYSPRPARSVKEHTARYLSQ